MGQTGGKRQNGKTAKRQKDAMVLCKELIFPSARASLLRAGSVPLRPSEAQPTNSNFSPANCLAAHIPLPDLQSNHTQSGANRVTACPIGGIIYSDLMPRGLSVGRQAGRQIGRGAVGSDLRSLSLRSLSSSSTIVR